MAKAGLVFPHQLFDSSILTSTCKNIYLIEESLYFKQFKFHKQKIAFHRASMKFYESYLVSKSVSVVYIDSFNELSDIRTLIPYLKNLGIDTIEYIDTTDDWLERRLASSAAANQIQLIKNQSPLFLNAPEANAAYFSGSKRMFQANFYKYQRQSRNILLETKDQPTGGKWSFDEENRLKYPKSKSSPAVQFVGPNIFYDEAVGYTEKYFPDNYGRLNADFIFPTTHDESRHWLKDFFKTRFSEFGAYEDAIVAKESILHHSVLTPLLNAGLLSPQVVIDEALEYASNHEITLNSVEGFIRQIIGWREYIRAVYELQGGEERTKNFWNFTRPIPESFWSGTTGIEPVDATIKKVLDTGYCHHIERLMVLGNFMLLCEFDPNEVYHWFMELFIDAYDWVMVPNVYGMSQFADGGIMSTKPYISGSNYIMKMSDYSKGPWQKVWDGLFWRFIHVHRVFFSKNPRLSMLVKSFDKMKAEKQEGHLGNAETYLKSFEK